MLQCMKEDLARKKKSMTGEESSKSADTNAMMKIANSMEMLSHAIMTHGFNQLPTANPASHQQFLQQYPMPGNFTQVLPCQGNTANFSYPQTRYSGFPPASVVDSGYGFQSRSVSPFSDASSSNSINEDDQ